MNPYPESPFNHSYDNIHDRPPASRLSVEKYVVHLAAWFAPRWLYIASKNINEAPRPAVPAFRLERKP